MHCKHNDYMTGASKCVLIKLLFTFIVFIVFCSIYYGLWNFAVVTAAALFLQSRKKEFVMHFRAFGKHSKNVIWGGTNQKNIREKLEWSKSGVSILNGWSHQNTLDHFSSAKNTQYTTSAFAIIASICNFGAVIFRVAKGYKMGFINCWKERFAESIDLIKLL